jgi:ribonuclease R
MKKWTKQSDPFSQRESHKYKHPIHSREFIIDYFSQHKKSMALRQIAKALKLSNPHEIEALRRRLRAMVRDGQLTQTRKRQYTLIEGDNLLTGRVIGCRDGFGFIAPEDGTSDILISAYQMRKVFDGDQVKFRIIDVDSQNRREGEIVDVIERKLTTITGRYFKEKDMGFVEPSNQRITHDIIIPEGKSGKAKSGQYVVVEIIAYPTVRSYSIAHVIEVLGDYLAPRMEIEVAIRAHGLPYKWPKPVLAAAKKLPFKITTKTLKERIDLRHLAFVTIDGEDSRDFDDAVYAEKRKKGGWQLYVAIADVSHYVKPNTQLDQIALERGTSVYFPQQVIPMLPEILSNDLCSLNPNADRLALVCQMTITNKGHVSWYRFYSAVISSHARLTYKTTYQILSEKLLEKTAYSTEILNNLHHLYAIYHVLEKQRNKRGALNFEMPEFKVILGKAGKIKQIKPIVRNIAHKLIEECMICANVCAAKFLSQHKMAALYRVHDCPTNDRLTDLKTFLREMGLKLNGGDLPSPKHYAKLTNQLEGRHDAYVIQIALLRSLSRAIYSVNNAGHFGLALEDYTHFTSPIRRYPDLMTHRAIRAIIEKQTPQYPFDKDSLVKIAEHCSITERRADDATNDAIDFLKCEYVKNQLGEDFDGVISRVTGFGLFVELTRFYLTGLVHISTLTDDYYSFEPIKHRIVGKRTGKIYRVGDKLRVKVAQVTLEEKQVDLVLA